MSAPAGPTVRLHDKAGGSQNDLKRSYDMASLSDLQTLAGQTIKGTWTLHVRDLAPADVGVLKAWSIRIRTRP